MKISISKSLTSNKGVGVRLLDIASDELVTNAQFTSDISNWTDASAAGGAIAYSAGKLRSTDTTGYGIASQTVPVTTGQRYTLIAEPAKTSTFYGICTFGSTAPGSSDYLFQPISPEKVALLDFTAVSSSLYAQIGTFEAGSTDWDYVSVRKLTATSFPAGKVFIDDFARSDGYMGATPEGVPWRNVVALGTAELIPKIVSGRVAMAQNASNSSAGYPYLDLGNGKAVSAHADVAWTGTGAAFALISVKKSGARLTVADILAASIHVVFTDTKVDIGIGDGGGITVLQTVTYSAPCLTDGTNYPNVGWELSGNTLTLRLPDQSIVTFTDSRLGALAGECACFEHYYISPLVGTLTFANATTRLG